MLKVINAKKFEEEKRMQQKKIDNLRVKKNNLNK